MGSLSRGDVVLLRFPNTDLVTYKLRPALVVQSDNFRSEYGDFIVVMITSRLDRPSDAIVAVTAESEAGTAMGLLRDSLVVVNRIVTVDIVSIDQKIGSCPLMDDVDSALRKVLGL